MFTEGDAGCFKDAEQVNADGEQMVTGMKMKDRQRHRQINGPQNAQRRALTA